MIYCLPYKDAVVGRVRLMFTIETAIVTDWRFVLFYFARKRLEKVETRL